MVSINGEVNGHHGRMLTLSWPHQYVAALKCLHSRTTCSLSGTSLCGQCRLAGGRSTDAVTEPAGADSRRRRQPVPCQPSERHQVTGRRRRPTL